MAKITRPQFENFFKFYKGEPHQQRALDLLYNAIDPSLLEEDAPWIQQYRTAESGNPVAYFSMDLRSSASLLRGRFEVRKGSRRLLSVVATSGINPHQGPDDWNIRGAGPIPPQKNISIDLTPIYLPQRGIEGNFYPVKPFNFNNGRGDFGVHRDANVPGTAGCIGIISGVDWAETERVFKSLAEDGHKSIPLVVSYNLGSRTVSNSTQTQTSTPGPTSTLEDALRVAKTSGCSARTASQDGMKQGGVAASRQLAQTDLNRARANLPTIREASRQSGVPVALIAAIASRESRVGNALDKGGWGDNGNGYGHMQVDKRYHDVQTQDGPAGLAHYLQACRIFASYLEQTGKKHPSWALSDRIRGALVAYNSGMSNVQTIERADVGTTGGDYSADVIARAQYYQTAL